MIVLKFGGTSVQDVEAVRRLIVITASRAGSRLVVVSALAKVTDQLVQICDWVSSGEVERATGSCRLLEERHLEMCRNLKLCSATTAYISDQFSNLSMLLHSIEAIGELSARSRDRILAMGELLSSVIVTEAFNAYGVKANWLDSRQVLRTDAQFTSAQVDFEATDRLCAKTLPPLFAHAEIVVTGGFIGAVELNGQLATTTLGRGGSDYSAAILGAALGAEKIEIWTDVDGILTTDPRVVPQAKIVRKLSYDEAAELAYFGAKVLHPATIHPAVKKNIPVWVLNSRNPGCPGTEITREAVSHECAVKAIACKRNVTLINIHSSRMLGAAGFLQSVFNAFGKERVSIDLISTSEVNVSLTLDPQSDRVAVDRVLAELSQFAIVTVEDKMASVAAVGRGIRTVSGVAARIFGALKGNNIAMISMGSSEINFSFVVKDEQVSAVIQKLHEEFFGETPSPVSSEIRFIEHQVLFRKRRVGELAF